MKDDSNKNKLSDDLSLEGLFEMAENYDDESIQFDDIDFYEYSGKEDAVYNSPKEALKAVFGYDSFRAGAGGNNKCYYGGERCAVCDADRSG